MKGAFVPPSLIGGTATGGNGRDPTPGDELIAAAATSNGRRASCHAAAAGAVSTNSGCRITFDRKHTNKTLPGLTERARADTRRVNYSSVDSLME